MNRNMKYCINSSGGGHGDQRQNDELFDAYSFGNSLASASFSNVDVGDGTDAIHNVPDSSYRYRVAHLLWERDMLTPNLKLRLAVSQARPARPVTEL